MLYPLGTMQVIFDWLTERLTLLPCVSKVLFPTPNGSERSQSEVKWCVPPAPSSPGKQSTASRNTWRFAKRSVGDAAVHLTRCEKERIVFPSGKVDMILRQTPHFKLAFAASGGGCLLKNALNIKPPFYILTKLL